MAKKIGCTSIRVDTYTPMAVGFNDAVDMILKNKATTGER